MNIFVCCKEVPDTAATPKVSGDGSGILEEDLEFVLSPYEEHAIEESLKIKDALGEGTITLVCVGGERAQKILRSPALAMGADRAILLKDEAYAGSDSHAAARAIAKVIEKEGAFDLIMCGKVAVDDGSGWFGPALAEMLGIPHVIEADKVEIAEDRKSVTVRREAEDGTLVVEYSLPAMITCNKALNAPRYPSLKGIMKAKKKPIDSPAPGDLDLEPSDVGAEGANLVLVKMEEPPEKKKECTIIEGEAGETAAQLAKLLREEAKVV